jgi:uncharacterized protein (TIGR02246 family)
MIRAQASARARFLEALLQKAAKQSFAEERSEAGTSELRETKTLQSNKQEALMRTWLKHFRFIVGVCALLGSGAARAAGAAPEKAAAQPKAAAAAPNTDNQADEKAIRATADAFVKAFNAGDVKAVGVLFAPDAEYTDESGQSIHGRVAIEKEYADLFKEHPGATMTVTVGSIRFLGPDTAVEQGVAKVQAPNADTATGARYTVVHAKRDGKWTMVVARDDRYVPESNEEYLKGLQWLIGDWTLDAKDRSLVIRFEWMAQKNFIKNTYTITKDGKATLTGGQIIGWNPKLRRIVSWHFGSEGGFGHDVWTKDGSKWVIEASGMFRDGAESSSVNILTPIDANSFTWQSISRTVDGVSLPDLQPGKIVRVRSGK